VSMRSRHGYRWLLIILFLLVVSPLFTAQTGSVPQENLVVTGRMDVISQHLKVAGNVTVMNEGRLILVNSTLEFVGAEPGITSRLRRVGSLCSTTLRLRGLRGRIPSSWSTALRSPL